MQVELVVTYCCLESVLLPCNWTLAFSDIGSRRSRRTCRKRARLIELLNLADRKDSNHTIFVVFLSSRPIWRAGTRISGKERLRPLWLAAAQAMNFFDCTSRFDAEFAPKKIGSHGVKCSYPRTYDSPRRINSRPLYSPRRKLLRNLGFRVGWQKRNRFAPQGSEVARQLASSFEQNRYGRVPLLREMLTPR